MTPSLDHDSCSALLAAFTRHELDEPTADAVGRHLQSCDRCTQERRAVDALLATEVEPLRTDERARLVAGVLDAVQRDRREGWDRQVAEHRQEARRPVRRRLRARGGGIFAAAATCVALAAGAVYLGSAGSGGEAAHSSRAGGGAESAERRALDGRDKGRATLEAAPGAGEAGGGGPAPTFSSIRSPLSERRLQSIGRGRRFRTYASSYAPEDVVTIRDRLLAQLEAAAPAGARAQIRTCARTVLERFTALPAYAARARLHGRPVLVVGFATSDGAGALRRFQLWAWPRGSCDVPVVYLQGHIRG
jgi:hypothetical protein